MSMPSAHIRCTKCKFEAVMPRRPVRIEYVLAGGATVQASRLFSWCSSCQTITDAVEPLDVTVLEDEIYSLERKGVGFFGRIFGGSNRASEERDELQSKLHLAQQKYLNLKCLRCGEVTATPLYFDERGLSKVLHSCGGHFYLAPDDPNAPRSAFALEVIRLDQNGDRLVDTPTESASELPSRATLSANNSRSSSSNVDEVPYREGSTLNSASDMQSGRSDAPDWHKRGEMLYLYLRVSIPLLGEKGSDPYVRVGIQIFIMGIVDMFRQIEKLNWSQFVDMYGQLLAAYGFKPRHGVEAFIRTVEASLSANNVSVTLMRDGAESIRRFVADRDTDAPTDLLSAAIFAQQNSDKLRLLEAV